MNNSNQNKAVNQEGINSKESNMKNLLFIEGNRQSIDKENVKASFNKIKSLGYIATMPIEYIPMEEAKTKLGDRKLFKANIKRKSGNGEATISNFEIILEVVDPADYDKYDGVCGDGQHRTLALMFSDLKEVQPTYTEIQIPENMDILSYIALRNNGKNWKSSDFYNSGISTNDKEVDYILEKCKDYEPSFVFTIYTLGTINLKPNQIKSIQLGYKTVSDFGKLQLNETTRQMGDRILSTLNEQEFISKDRMTGRFAVGLKQYYNEVKDIIKIIDVLTLIDKTVWDNHFTPANGQSMEAKSYADAFKAVYNEYELQNK